MDALHKEWFFNFIIIIFFNRCLDSATESSQVQTTTTQQPEAGLLHSLLNFINIPTISETHPDDPLADSDVNIEDFSIFRTDIDRFIGEAVISTHNHFLAKAHYDFMRDNTEAVFVHSPHQKPESDRCFSRSAHTDEPYLNHLCEMLDKLSDSNSGICFSCGSNINWLGQSATEKNKVFPSVSDCHSERPNMCRQWTRWSHSWSIFQFNCLCPNGFEGL